MDLVQVPARHWRMAQDTIQYLVLHRCDPSCNMARYYVLSIEPSLFGDATLIREWGRIGQQSRIVLDTCATPDEAEARPSSCEAAA